MVDGNLPLSENSEVLGDALKLLASRSLRVGLSRIGQADDDAEPGINGGGESAAAGARRLVAVIARKQLIEGIVPLLIDLRVILQQEKHPLLISLMSCLAALLQDHKADIEDVLAGDKQLAKELIFDMKKAEQAVKLQQAQKEQLEKHLDQERHTTSRDCASSASVLQQTPHHAEVPSMKNKPGAAEQSHHAMPPPAITTKTPAAGLPTSSILASLSKGHLPVAGLSARTPHTSSSIQSKGSRRMSTPALLPSGIKSSKQKDAEDAPLLVMLRSPEAEQALKPWSINIDKPKCPGSKANARSKPPQGGASDKTQELVINQPDVKVEDNVPEQAACHAHGLKKGSSGIGKQVKENAIPVAVAAAPINQKRRRDPQCR